jgi:hypothetical protein
MNSATVSGVEHVLLAGLDLSPLVGPEEGGQAAIVAQQVKTFRQFGRYFVFWDLIYKTETFAYKFAKFVSIRKEAI